MGHFFQSYYFDLDKTLYIFTSGRYEYRNKGYDLTLEALARLNWRMKQANVDKTVVMFFITKKPFQSINPNVLQSKASLDKMYQTTEAIQKQLGERLIQHIMQSEDQAFPDLNEFDDDKDDILNFLRSSNLCNYKEDKVKIVYHPDFVNSVSPLFGIDYPDFVRGTHLGIFPSYYEPWGYTPLECMVSGVAAITSDLSGFGDYFLKANPASEDDGIAVIRRRNRSYDEAANQLADAMFAFVQSERSSRISQRYSLQRSAEQFDWKHLTSYYEKAYDLVLERTS